MITTKVATNNYLKKFSFSAPYEIITELVM